MYCQSDNLTGVLGPEPNKSPNKEDTRSPITGPPENLTDDSKSSTSAGTSEESDTEVSLALSSENSRKVLASREIP
ncbi:hypothetical protein AYI68_g6185 [Smittium mucronatum]|uniref:Uncharacterized protein n=1 Tax=Smittium mucronatum TaxID=133383 RepID=A0A1R0GS57_9FUNG|nr:hypothetical protein AYI68_g6185 [Smittium mucronatum]